jgi:hypothetical protein
MAKPPECFIVRVVDEDGSGLGCRRPGPALFAQTPEDDLGLVDLETVRLRRLQARRLTDGAIDVCNGAARSTHEVVVIVSGSCLEPCG